MDTIGHLWAENLGIDTRQYEPDWKLGRHAGFLRNAQMLKYGKPDVVIAFPGGSGTENMIELTRKAKTRLIEFPGLYFKKECPDYGFLSNFYKAEQIDSDGVVYPTNEHFYQSRKTLNEKERAYVLEDPDPGVAKKRGRAVNCRHDWEEIKRPIMLEGLRQKFPEGSELAHRLLNTGSVYLFEYTTWNDQYWGVNTSLKGENHLGKLLMVRRKELRRLRDAA